MMAVVQVLPQSVVLTVVDLKVVDSQSFENSHTGFVDVERLTQL